MRTHHRSLSGQSSVSIRWGTHTETFGEANLHFRGEPGGALCRLAINPGYSTVQRLLSRGQCLVRFYKLLTNGDVLRAVALASAAEYAVG